MTNKRLLPLLALLAAFPPVTTDMYLPALPMLQEMWRVDLATINLTLVVFFIFFSGFLLVYGPLSDNYGRRPLLLAGIGIYICGSVMCGFAGNVNQLIFFRILQAIGAAAGSSLAMAIARDLFAAKARERLLAQMAVIMALAPMLSPIAGGAVLKWLAWRWIFFFQAAAGAIAFSGVWRMAEPLAEMDPSSFVATLRRYLRLIANRRYMTTNVMMAFSICPMFGFIAASPNIYIARFQASEQAFGFFFGFNAFALMAGSFACSNLLVRFSTRFLMITGFAGICAGGVLVLALGGTGPFGFAAAMFVVTFCIGLTRPMSNNLVLEQVDRDIGAASSLLVFLYFVVGAAIMWTVSQDWLGQIRLIGSLAILCGALVLILFHVIEP